MSHDAVELRLHDALRRARTLDRRGRVVQAFGTTVRATLTRDAAIVRLAVHDNGPGVPVELQRSVFQRFARGDTSRNRSQGSTGLGLSIVAAVASAHGGTVALDSRPGDTTFTVTLPASA